MKFFRIGTVAALLAVTAGAAEAQRGERPGMGERGKSGHMLGGHLADSLGLTEAQRNQIRAIHERYRAQAQQLNAGLQTHMRAAAEARQRGDTAAARGHREQARAAMETTRAQRQALNQSRQAEVRAVLTPEQQAKLDQFRALQRERAELRRERMRERGQRAPGMRGPRAPRQGTGT